MGKGREFNNEKPERAIAGYGDNVNRIGRITIPLDSALDLEDIGIIGNFFYAESATSKNANFLLRLNDQYDSPVTVKEGLFIAGMKFDKGYVSCAAQAGESITLIYGIESGNLRIVNPADQFNDVDLVRGNDFHGINDVALSAAGVTLIAATDTTRRALHITNLSGNASTIRVGGNTTTSATRGTPIAPGQTFTIQHAAGDNIYAYNPGAIQSVALSHEQD